MSNVTRPISNPATNAQNCTKEMEYTFFYRQLDFSSQPRVANEILENELKSCLTVA